MPEDEIPLTGGAQTPGLVRVGATVRRPAHARSDVVQALLRHLEAAGFDGAPRALGYDERGREVLEFVEGEVPAGPPYALSDARLLSAARLIRRFHDATVSSPLCRGQEVVCHGDLGAHNTVFRGEQAVALIDWDAGLAPGRRAVDFAHAVWCFADLTGDAVPVAEQARRTRLMCAAYPGMTPRPVVDELTARFHRARPAHGRRAGRRGRGPRPALAWVQAHGAAVAGEPGTPGDR